MTAAHALQAPIEALWEQRETLSPATRGAARECVDAALNLLDEGTARGAARDGGGGWVVHQWLKKAGCSRSG